MTSRTAAVTIGLIAGIGIFLALRLDWGATIAAFNLQNSYFASQLAAPLPRLAWSVAAGMTVFGVLASLVALIGGAGETARARARLSALRLDPILAGSWNAADWRAAFVPTAVADQAEAMIALLPIESGEARRVVVDTHLLTGLAQLWLERLALNRTLSPLPALVAAQGVALAAIDAASGGRWELEIAAGAAGWLLIALAHYLTRAVLAPLTVSAVDAATAVIRPLTPIHTVTVQVASAGVSAPQMPDDARALAAALAGVLTGPLDRLTEAADRLGAANAGPSREQTIDAALAEIRAGIERLLDAGGQRNED